MRNIHDYSEKELKKLHGEFKKLKTYEDKVAFVYSHFGRVFGHINQDGAGPDFSIKPKDEKENEIRWMHFFNARKEEVLQKLMADYRDRYEKAPDEAVFIEASLLEVRKIYESNSNLMYGYEMGSLAKGLDWIHWDQFYMDWTGTLEPYYEGWAYYRLEQWLKGLKDIPTPSIDLDSIDESTKRDIQDPMIRFAIAHELGIIEHVGHKFCGTNRNALADLLAILFGISLNGKDRDRLYEWVKKYYSADITKSPANPTNIKKAQKILYLIDISLTKPKE
jgi:hypothetical protein